MKEIEEYLRANVPEIPDEGEFMIETNARLGAVEGIKAEVDAGHRRFRLAMIIALSAGILAGCALTLLVLFSPIGLPEAADGFLSGTLRFVREAGAYIYIFMGACALSLGLLLAYPRYRLL